MAKSQSQRRPGRKRLSDSEWNINIRLPGDLIRRVDAHAQSIFEDRRTAVEQLLERGLGQPGP